MIIRHLYVSGDSIWAGTAHRVGNLDKSGLYFTTDAGNNWVQIDSALGDGVILGFDLVPPLTLFILKGSGAYSVAGTLYKSTNNGGTWISVSNNINSAIQWFGISPFNKNEVYAFTYNPFPAGLINTLFKSTDGGNTWLNISAFPSSSHGSILSFAFDMIDSTSLYVTVNTQFDQYFYKSTNKGDSWFFISEPPVTPPETKTDLFLPDRIYLFAYYKASDDGGLSWYDAYSGLQNNIDYLSFHQDGETTKLLYNLRKDGLYSSRNDSIYWCMVDGTEDLPIYFGPTGFFDDRNMKNIFIESIKKELFLGTAKGIYKTTIITNIANDNNVEYNFSLNQNYPNPFNPSTTISYQIPETSFITIKMYDVLGNEIATLVNEEKPAGSYEVEFHTAIYSWQLTSGMYFYQLKVGNYVETKKMLLIK